MSEKKSSTFIARVFLSGGGYYKGKRYVSYRLTIPAKAVKELGLTDRDYVKVTIEKVEVE